MPQLTSPTFCNSFDIYANKNLTYLGWHDCRAVKATAS